MISLLDEVEKHGVQRVLGRVDGLDAQSAELFRVGLINECVDRSRVDGLFWLRWVETRDEADPEHSIKPFPIKLEYLRELWAILNDKQRVVIAKSRQMLVSWVVCAFCVWWARHKPHQAIYWQTQQWRDACGMVCQADGAMAGRCQFIESHLPRWMYQDSTKFQEGCITYPNGSMIQALAGGADQIRGKVASVIVEDEAAKQEEFTGVYQTIAPLLQKGARLIIVGTPNGTSNTFATIYHGRPVGAERV